MILDGAPKLLKKKSLITQFSLVYFTRRTFCGTYEYMAPEMINKQPYNDTIDIWGLGILLYELLHGYSPFRGPRPEDISRNI